MSTVTHRIRRQKGSALKVVHLNRLWKVRGSPRFSWKTKGETKVSDGRGSDECLKTSDSGLSNGPKIQATTKRLRDDRRPVKPVKQQATFQGMKEHQVAVQPKESKLDSSSEPTWCPEIRRDRRPPKRYGNYICHIGCVEDSVSGERKIFFWVLHWVMSSQHRHVIQLSRSLFAHSHGASGMSQVCTFQQVLCWSICFGISRLVLKYIPISYRNIIILGRVASV